MINDRGRIKWSPFLIPQHKKRIAQWYEAETDVNKPEFDEQFFEQLQETIVKALEGGAEVSVTYHASKRFSTVNGVILKVDPFTREMILDSKGERFKIRMDSITDLQKK